MIVPALITPFDAAGRPDAGALQDLIDRLTPQVDGFLVLGSTGEAVTLAPDERAALLQRLDVGKPLWVGVGDESLALARRHAEAAVASGAARLLAMPPRFYDRALDARAFRVYFEGLAELGEVWLYHVPVFTRANFPVEVVAELARHPRIVGIKDSSGEMARLEHYRRFAPGLRVFTGSGTTLPAAVASGAEGAILAVGNLAPRLFARVLEDARAGRLDARLAGLAYETAALVGRGGVTLLKQALRHLGLPVGVPRAPLPETSPLWPEAERLLARLQEEGWLL
ncbi:dihydrodipicolinate synthase family protein [Oceanithermus sp.]|uniref:dihydrodipicolinate synthase family protein n=1 Tax=Oceanithermus sp. TaxID=2268145 RepID=UPI00257EE93D|nr:dihydrodipicolinate synthase family protein [Oceanithermus sp.]